MGKDISGSTTEVITAGDPGAFVALATAQYHLYRSGASPFFSKHDVSDTLSQDTIVAYPFDRFKTFKENSSLNQISVQLHQFSFEKVRLIKM